MTVRGGRKQEWNKHIQIDGFDFAGIQYRNENTKETGWHIQVNLAGPLSRRLLGFGGPIP